MAIKHIKHLRTLVPESLRDEIPMVPPSPVKKEKHEMAGLCGTGTGSQPHSGCVCKEKFYMGYKEAVDEVRYKYCVYWRISYYPKRCVENRKSISPKD